MIDESALASGIYQSLGKCLVLREKYQNLSLQDHSNNLTDEECSPSDKSFDGIVPLADDKAVFSLCDEGFFQVFASNEGILI